MSEYLSHIHNGQSLALKDIRKMSFDEFKDIVVKQTQKGARVVSFFGQANADNTVVLFMILAKDKEGCLNVLSTVVKDEYPSLTVDVAQVHLFECEIFEQCAVKPKGHPALKRLRKHFIEKDTDSFSKTKRLNIEGAEIHEVAVGPVHAGIIEPGHFRFQCHGEKVFDLDVSLGYQHRGVEKALIGGPDKRTLHYMETVAGDTTIGHSLAYAQAIESLSNCEVSLRASVIRAIMLELERLANHTGDLGALAGDIGFLPTSEYCGRLRGDFLNITALVCGNRFGRNIIKPGGVAFDLTSEMILEMKERLEKTFSDVKNAVSLLWDSSLVVDRFDQTGILTKQTALDLGIVGVAVRACGVERDVRFDFPTGAFRFSHIPVSTYSSGDVFARAFVRWLEIQRSVEFILDQLDTLPQGESMVDVPLIQQEKMVVSLVEGWRGEISHVLRSDENGKIAHYKIVDPSFHNWKGLSLALRNEEISDFPICNKSFNLSYCGHDL